MNRTFTVSLIAVALAAAAVGYSVSYYSGSRATGTTTHAAAATPDANGGRKVLYWYDPMVPDKRFDQPGKSPFMDMPLTPRYADEVQDNGGVTVSPRQQQNLGVRTAKAERRELQPHATGYGTVALNERTLRTLVAPSGGVVEQLGVNAVQQPVQKGQMLAVLWNPTWAAAQQEYLAVRQLGDAELSQAARQKLALMFMPESVIRQVERSGKPQPRLTITAPENGYINRLDVRTGAQLTPAQPLFELASLDPVWVEVEYPAAQAAALHIGDEMLAVSDSWPGDTFRGRVAELLPQLDSATRTLKARVVLDNRQQRLKPGMYLTVKLAAGVARQALMVPQQALLVSSRQNRVLLNDGQGYFTPRPVDVGVIQDGWAEIRSGLNEGDSVVISGQFLIDSEASLRSALTSFSDAPQNQSPAATPAPVGDYQTRGVIKAINGKQVTLAHDAVPALDWPPMTMDFTFDGDALPATLQPGMTVTFRFRLDDNGARLLAIQPVAAAAHGGHL
ncbi:efflux RND transporter periplasmic adaptor subunit [Dickeya fangzhongdai]|uniref:Efflux RND transporter periplasmic adaptor subunit n=1 Tax=Dickeya fangzhongdai TaxID=1778540 RepID=A0A2K8QL47_9GAMM|nr:efflux RND transporter periplasmic adaptor subunit [Dickeya fangzhongdai]ATZ93748.1 efflux RND transporter periplasmic adaptor subunit [Dickeya fangzhongdai]QOH47181.1 efflux RND transporter periplasmic adaptor subunit [Dickeya fangzhongdai]QOH51487.1 efflux RND transporter periplasmic adaptor subunit [Dickeya fangzhongdai]WOY01336.1 efflux RND transporter periplasmic adaptor subunit [Dickeya fangzhongdai]WOY03472.1 efflux RND transporter periplasmic adaptor subunit [Dickeya fangzhongdai]